MPPREASNDNVKSPAKIQHQPPFISRSPIKRGIWLQLRATGTPGCKVVIYGNPKKRTTWAPYRVDGWYIDSAPEHYSWHIVYVTKTRSERIVCTVIFFPHSTTMHRKVGLNCSHLYNRSVIFPHLYYRFFYLYLFASKCTFDVCRLLGVISYTPIYIYQSEFYRCVFFILFGSIYKNSVPFITVSTIFVLILSTVDCHF